VKGRLARYGRRPEHLKIMPGIFPVIGSTQEEAQEKFDALQALLNSVIPFTLIAWAERSVEAGLATILNSTSPVMAFLGTWL
ncbi:hypothetical protein AB4Y44_42895, partial [Paraburkholderia sp. BR10937]